MRARGALRCRKKDAIASAVPSGATTPSASPGADGAKAPSCSICLELFQPSETIRILPCFHQFHQDCVDKWLFQKAECPVCKVCVK